MNISNLFIWMLIWLNLLSFSASFIAEAAMVKAGPEFQVNKYEPNSQKNPKVALLSDSPFTSGSRFVVVWQSTDQDGSGEGVYGQIFDAIGNKIGSEFRVNSETDGDQRMPSIAGLHNGGFFIAWESYNQDGSKYGVFGQRFYGSGAKAGSEFQVNSTSDYNQIQPSVGALANGNFVVAWASELSDGSGYGIVGQLFGTSGNKIGWEFQVNTFSFSSQNAPAVAGLSNGGFVVAWESLNQDGSGEGVYGQLFSDDRVKVGGEFKVNSYMDNDQSNPCVAALSYGDFVVVWVSRGDQDGSGEGVYGQLFDAAGAKVGGEFPVNSYTNFAQRSPSVAGLPRNHFIVSWQSSDSQDGDWFGIFAQKFNGAGDKIGVEFQVNTYTANNQQNPAAACLPNGRIVVAWQSYGQDGSGDGIYGKIFKNTLSMPWMPLLVLDD